MIGISQPIEGTVRIDKPPRIPIKIPKIRRCLLVIRPFFKVNLLSFQLESIAVTKMKAINVTHFSIPSILHASIDYL